MSNSFNTMTRLLLLSVLLFHFAQATLNFVLIKCHHFHLDSGWSKFQTSSGFKH